MRARVAYAGAIHEAYPHANGVQLADGRICTEDEVVWLSPIEPGTIVALGLNYAEHAKELQFSKQDEPLVFLKGPGSVIGHRGFTRRPKGVAFMHYECELAVVIGKSAKSVPRNQAMDYVSGYMVANDYAIRDYLENYYRPNLRVKNRDGGTVLGPWFVDAEDQQRGNTSDLVNDIPALIEYLSGFMTLAPGDVILTGTPEGIVNVDEGDEVVCEIDGLGRLVNHIASDAVFNRG